MGQSSKPVGDGPRLAAFVLHESPKQIAEAPFQAEDSSTRTLADWQGKWVLVNLWATWCAPCRHEMPALDRLQARLGGDDFEVVTISVDRGGFDKPKAFFEEIGIENLTLYNEKTSRISAKFGVIGMPTTLLIDADGREVGRLAGPAEWDSTAAIDMLTRVAGLGP
ncbi:MAG: TlpA family protein disulfide reductase [Rhizobiales bacterium]|nr:TlpA family protein disulfide reductase [Hyphomicrobiales bacterium]